MNSLALQSQALGLDGAFNPYIEFSDPIHYCNWKCATQFTTYTHKSLLMKFTNICPVCNATNNEFIAASLSKWMLFHLYGWRVDVPGSTLALNAPAYKCQECDFIYFSGRYDSTELRKIYSDYHGKRIDSREIFDPAIRKMGGGSEYSGVMQANRKKYFKDFIANVKFENISRPKLLDWGGEWFGCA